MRADNGHGGAGRAKSVSARDITHELIASLNEAKEIIAGRVAPTRFYPARAGVDVRAVCKRFDMSQPDFAHRFGFSVAT